jgi:hypothetical protein
VLGAGPVRTTELDLRRPARDLLEHLLGGIAACHLLYADFDEGDDSSDSELEGNPDSESESIRRDRIANEFADLVRAQAGSVDEG